jgi:hypothetical protein
MSEPRPTYFKLEDRIAETALSRQENRAALDKFFRNSLIVALARDYQVTGARPKNTTTGIEASWQLSEPDLTKTGIEEKYLVIEGLIGTDSTGSIFRTYEIYRTLDKVTGKIIGERKIPLPDNEGHFEFNQEELFNQLRGLLPKP